MAVTIRLQRQGTRNRPFYHIVATDSRKKRDGAVLEKVGYYDPKGEPSVLEVKSERVQFWFERGAQMSNTVSNLVGIKKVTLTRAKTTAKAKTAPKAKAKK